MDTTSLSMGDNMKRKKSHQSTAKRTEGKEKKARHPAKQNSTLNSYSRETHRHTYSYMCTYTYIDVDFIPTDVNIHIYICTNSTVFSCPVVYCMYYNLQIQQREEKEESSQEKDHGGREKFEDGECLLTIMMMKERGKYLLSLSFFSPSSLSICPSSHPTQVSTMMNTE